MPIDYQSASALLAQAFDNVEADLLQGRTPSIDEALRDECEILFNSSTQAYREVLLGCIIARLQDRSINVRQPYVGHGPNAFNGRTLDERSINPFLQSRRIPSSRGPYLSVFRRSVDFNLATRDGLRDKDGYDALLSLLSIIETTSDENVLLRQLHYVLYKICPAAGTGQCLVGKAAKD